MHDAAILRITSQYVGYYLTESLGEQTLVNVLDSVVNVLLGCAHTPHHVSLVTHWFVCFKKIIL